MKKGISLLVAVCLVLYIGPVLFMPSYASPAIPTQEKIAKDFSISDEYTYTNQTSNQSITSFSETLDDDVFYTPDGFYDDTPVTASDGYDDWADSIHFNDSLYWSSFDTIDEYINFRGDHSIEGFEYSIYGRALITNGNVTVYDTMAQDVHVLEEMVTGSDAWYNGTYWGTNYEPKQVYLNLVADTGSAITVDYIELRFHYLPLYDYSSYEGFTNYGESFTNVSEWEIYAGAGTGIFSDGDIGYMEVPNDNNYDVVLVNDLGFSTEGCYLEVRHKENTTSGVTFALILKSENDYGGDTVLSCSITESATWRTEKFYISSSLTTECIAFLLRSSGADVKLEIDYLRISPADEMGFQHDGSTLEGVVAGDGGSISTDGDFLSLISDADGSTFNFSIDETTTASAIDPDYYLFIELKFHPSDSADNYRLDCWRGSGYGYYNTIQSYTTVGDSVIRFNLRVANVLDTYSFRITGYSSQTIRLDYIKAYSIANFTVTQSASCTTTDVLYCESTSLFVERDTSYNIALNYDPTFSLDGLEYVYVDVSTTAYSAFTFYETLGTSQLVLNNQKSGYNLAGAITDFLFYPNCDMRIGEILFIGHVPDWHTVDTEVLTFNLPEWNLVQSVIIYFVLPIGQANIQPFLLLLGIFLIPTSTLYLAKGGTKEMSSDKVFYFCIMLMLGLGLFLGGIL